MRSKGDKGCDFFFLQLCLMLHNNLLDTLKKRVLKEKGFGLTMLVKYHRFLLFHD